MKTLKHFSKKQKGWLVGFSLLAVVTAINGIDMLEKACVMDPPNVMLTNWTECQSYIDSLDPSGNSELAKNLRRLQELNNGRKSEMQLALDRWIPVLEERFYWIKFKARAAWLLFAACLIGIISLFRGNASTGKTKYTEQSNETTNVQPDAQKDTTPVDIESPTGASPSKGSSEPSPSSKVSKTSGGHKNKIALDHQKISKQTLTELRELATEIGLKVCTVIGYPSGDRYTLDKDGSVVESCDNLEELEKALILYQNEDGKIE